jgi:hypothetical protein
MATKTFRQHLVWYSRGLIGGKEFRKAVLTLEDPRAVEDAIAAFFGSAILDRSEEADAGLGEEADDGVDYKQAFG